MQIALIHTNEELTCNYERPYVELPSNQPYDNMMMQIGLINACVFELC